MRYSQKCKRKQGGWEYSLLSLFTNLFVAENPSYGKGRVWCQSRSLLPFGFSWWCLFYWSWIFFSEVREIRDTRRRFWRQNFTRQRSFHRPFFSFFAPHNILYRVDNLLYVRDVQRMLLTILLFLICAGLLVCDRNSDQRLQYLVLLLIDPTVPW